MKSSKTIIYRLILYCILLAFSNIKVFATPSDSILKEVNNVNISLLTCSPGTEIYSVYGHTAIRVQDPVRGTDVVVNFGLFNKSQPYFTLRFIFGLADYEMGMCEYRYFEYEYRTEGRSVVQQTLNLSPEEKLRILSELERNYLPENRVYRYNFLYGNCTTRSRDVLADDIGQGGDKVVYHQAPRDVSFRDMIHQYCADYPWTKFGKDLILGVKADAKTDLAEQQFLPDNLMNDFGKATVGGRPLVAKTEEIIPQGDTDKGADFPLSPTQCGLVLALASLAVLAFELKNRRVWWGVDTLMMLLCGLPGIILFAMIFSKHPTVSLNFQIFVLNPLLLIALPHVICRARKHRATRWFYIQDAFILLFLIGGIWQDYAEGMYFVALSLLCRGVSHFFNDQKRAR